jgi:hypothetical protein
MGTGPSALQRHVGFFDPEATGRVTMRQTAEGMHRLGVHWVWRMVLPPIINGFLGYLTEGKPSLVIRIDRIADGKHPFDSGVFDETGEHDAAAFEALFAAAGGEALTAEEIRAVITARGNRMPQMGRLGGSLGHWFSSREVQLFFCLAADTTKFVDGRAVPAVRKETLRAFYDGTLFPQIVRRRLLVEAGCVKARPRPT